MSRSDPRFAGLPEPAKDRLVVYVFGPSPGESQVVALPDGRWIVIDGCVDGGHSLPEALLGYFGVERVDLLVVTHPDLDHLRGLAPLVKRMPVVELWRYPCLAAQRDVAARLCNLDPTSKRWTELRALLAAIDDLARDNRAFEVGLGDQSWPHGDGAPYSVHCLAPCSADRHAEVERFQRFFDKVAAGALLDEADGRLVLGRADGGRGNPLSLALVLRWGEVGVLFGGDVEAPKEPSTRGWNGILATLERRQELARIRDLTLVKVAHHGSSNALSHDAWAHHASGGRVRAVVTPFNGAAGMPPHRAALHELTQYASDLCVTAQPHSAGWEAVEDTPWRPREHEGVATAPVVAVAFGPDGSVEEVAGRGARIYTA